MSAIAAVCLAAHDPSGAKSVHRLLAACAARGNERSAVHRDGLVSLGVGRFAWECVPGLADDVLIAGDGPLLVAADASLYYREDLASGLGRAGVPLPSTTSPAAWILAAYRAWGLGCLERLEGDFAFLLWDGRRRRLLAARDFGGTRPLFFAVDRGTVTFASAAGAVAHAAGRANEYNLLALAEDAGGLNSMVTDETCFAGVVRVPAGGSVEWTPDAGLECSQWWEPPVFERDSGVSHDDAARHLAELLGSAVEERCLAGGTTAVWMSGGYDSSSVYAAGRRREGRTPDGARLWPVSMSYPVGDRGREDEYIQRIAGHWKTGVTWVDNRAVAPLDRPYERALGRDEPFVHAFEMWNRALVDGARSAGARVALSGNGGDQLFQVSPVILADAIAGGRLLSAWREWHSGFRGAGFRFFFRWALQPLLPPTIQRLAGIVRGGRPLRPYLVDELPPWFDRGFVRRSGLEDRIYSRPARRRGESRAASETAWYFQGAFGPRIIGAVSAIGLDGGVEVRSPLYDGRILAFAATRPRSERRGAGETKRLLRRSMHGALPEDVLAPRPRRTGLPGGYLERCLAEALPPMVAAMRTEAMLADLGIVDLAAFRRMWDRCALGHDDARRWRAQLYQTAATEFWLRSRGPGHRGTEVLRVA